MSLLLCVSVCGCGNTKNKSNLNSTKSQATSEQKMVKSFKELKIDENNKIVVNDTISKIMTNQKQSYSIEQLHFEDQDHFGKLAVTYPKLKGDKDYSKVNEIIKNAVSSHIEQDEKESPLNIDLDYEVKNQSDDLLSIVFTGLAVNKEAAHPSKIFFTINYDLSNDKAITLTDVTTVDQKFFQVLKGLMKDQVENDIYNAMVESNDDMELLTETYTQPDALFCINKNKLYIGFSVQGAGDYTEYIVVK